MKHLSKNSKLNAVDFSVDTSLCKESCELAIEKLDPYCMTNPAKNGLYGTDFPNKLKRKRRLINSKRFVKVITNEIKESNALKVRCYAFGDLGNLDHLKKWCNVCKNCKDNKFWLSTRQDSILYEFFEVKNMKKPENMNILYSMPLKLEYKPVFLENFLDKHGIGKSIITAKKSESNCQASKKNFPNNKCGNCTKCWTSKFVAYFTHGLMKKRKRIQNYFKR